MLQNLRTGINNHTMVYAVVPLNSSEYTAIVIGNFHTKRCGECGHKTSKFVLDTVFNGYNGNHISLFRELTDEQKQMVLDVLEQHQ